MVGHRHFREIIGSKMFPVYLQLYLDFERILIHQFLRAGWRSHLIRSAASLVRWVSCWVLDQSTRYLEAEVFLASFYAKPISEVLVPKHEQPLQRKRTALQEIPEYTARHICG